MASEFVVEVTMKVVVRVSPESFHAGFKAEVGEVAADWVRVLATHKEWDQLVDAVKVIAVEEE